jgi:regulator of protease activity HflC (stomatin/prohibitin superfamily)
MQFVLTREKQEAERKRIEADGIAMSQRIIGQGLTESLLRFRGIEATLKLAESPNTKVVVVGGGRDGLPLILGDVK